MSRAWASERSNVSVPVARCTVVPSAAMMASTKCEVAAAMWTGKWQDRRHHGDVDDAAADAEEAADEAHAAGDGDPFPHLERVAEGVALRIRDDAMDHAAAGDGRDDGVAVVLKHEEAADEDEGSREKGVELAPRDVAHDDGAGDRARQRGEREPAAAAVVDAALARVGDGARGGVRADHEEGHGGDRLRVLIRVEQQQHGHEHEPAARAHERAEGAYGEAKRDEPEVVRVQAGLLRVGRRARLGQTGMSGCSP